MTASVPSHFKYQKNAVPFYIMWIFVGLSFVGFLSEAGMSFSYFTVDRLNSLACQAFYMIWIVIALHKEAFLLEEDKLFWRCLPWLGMAALSGIISGISWRMENDFRHHAAIFLMRSVLCVTMFFCFRYSRFFRPWRYAQSVLPQYCQPHA